MPTLHDPHGTAAKTGLFRLGALSPDATSSSQILLLQVLVTIVLCYQLLFSRNTILSFGEQEFVILGLVLLFSGLMVLPPRVRETGWFIGALVLCDTAITTAIIYLSGNARSELYLTYFVIILIAAFTPTVKQFVGLAVILCAAYGGILYLGVGEIGSLAEGHLLQIPVLLIMALFYGGSMEMVRRERQEKARLLETIAALTKSDEALRESQKRFGLTIDNANDAIFYLDLYDLVRWANSRAEVITGRPIKEIVGRPLMAILSPEARTRAEAQVAAAARGEAVPSLVEFEVMRPDGMTVWLEMNSADVKEDGELAGRLVVARDRTERKHIEQQLRQAEKLSALGSLLDGVAHELNNPLFMISGYAELAAEKIKRGESAGLTEDLDSIQEAARRAAAIVQRSMSVARSATGRRERCDVNALLQRTLEVMGNDFLIHQIAVRTDLQADLPHVLADPQELTQMFLNLMTNARHAMATTHGQGTLAVTTALHSHQARLWVEIRVADDGPGILPEHLPRIFDPFFATDSADPRRALGLAICHRIVTDLGGTVTCESPVGQGATFLFRLPAAAES